MTADPIDPSRCPLCGDANACGASQGAGTCWCFSTPIADEVRARVPAAQKDRACICERCASGQRGAAEAQAILEKQPRR